jgi:hypothetical protein
VRYPLSSGAGPATSTTFEPTSVRSHDPERGEGVASTTSEEVSGSEGGGSISASGNARDCPTVGRASISSKANRPLSAIRAALRTPEAQFSVR